LTTSSQKKFERIHAVVWSLKSLYLCPRAKFEKFININMYKTKNYTVTP